MIRGRRRITHVIISKWGRVIHILDHRSIQTKKALHAVSNQGERLRVIRPKYEMRLTASWETASFNLPFLIGKGHASSGLALVASLGIDVSTATSRSEASTSITLETTTALAARTIATATASTTTSGTIVGISAVNAPTRPAFLDLNLFGSNLVRVCSDGSVVASAVSKFDESTVLGEIWSAKTAFHCQVVE